MSENRILWAALSDHGTDGRYLILQRVILSPKKTLEDAMPLLVERWPTAKFESWYVTYRGCSNGISDIKL
jgi:hypothetical protein